MVQTGPYTRCRRIAFFFAVVAFLVFFTAIPSNGQSKTVALSQRQMPVGQALSEIEKQTDLIFTVNHSLVDVNKPVKFSRQELRLEQALNQLTRALGFEYKLVGHHIVLIRPEKRARPASKTEALPLPVVADIVEIEPEIEPEPEYIPVPDTIREPFSLLSPSPKKFSLPGRYTYANPGRFPGVREQPKYAVKTNLVYGATLTPNLAFEFATGKQTTLTFAAGYNPWNVDGSFDDNDKFAHRLVETEFRYWPCERFNRTFWGVHAFAADFNIGGYDVPQLFKKEYRYEGWGAGLGVNFGYHLILKNRWSLEFTAGLGVAYLDYDRYPCEKCEQMEKDMNDFYFGPTKLGINLVFMLK